MILDSIFVAYLVFAMKPFHGVEADAAGQSYIPEPVVKVKASPTITGKNATHLPPSSYDALLQAYFGDNWKTAKAIAKCESGLNHTRVNDNPRTGDYSVGLFQINLYGRLAAGRPEESWLLVPENNVSYAAQMSGGGSNWGPWTCSRKIRN